jgi:hypothetical protein
VWEGKDNFYCVIKARYTFNNIGSYVIISYFILNCEYIFILFKSAIGNICVMESVNRCLIVDICLFSHAAFYSISFVWEQPFCTLLVMRMVSLLFQMDIKVVIHFLFLVATESFTWHMPYFYLIMSFPPEIIIDFSIIWFVPLNKSW